MKRSVVLVAAAILVLGAAAALAADVAGKWTAQIAGRGGQTRETTFTFKVEGTKLTGTVSTGRNEAQITDGKVEGDEISFTVTQERQGRTMKMMYKGKVTGGEIKFKRTRDGGGQEQEFTAKRATT